MEPLPEFKLPDYASSCNACRQCTPLGACLAFKGIEGAVPYLHGSQGCATYIRRYIISHFREPIDIASSSFTEDAAIFGGEKNFRTGIGNLTRQYSPKVIGVATTCLSETIGDDVPSFLRRIEKEIASLPDQPKLVHVSTPSYTGSHIDGFHEAARAVVSAFAEKGPRTNRVAVFPGMVSAADLRALKKDFKNFGLHALLIPDYSETMDGPAWGEYHRIAPGGTPVEELKHISGARAVMDLTRCMPDTKLGGAWLTENFGMPRHRLAAPIGIASTDRWLEQLSTLSGRSIPGDYSEIRGRLIDALVDGHKYLSGVPVALFGEADHVLAMAEFFSGLGMEIRLAGTGGKTPGFELAVQAVLTADANPIVLNGVDFLEIEAAIEYCKPEVMIGNSKGYTLARKLDLPLLRTGFPIHDRFGGQRMLHFGYEGAQRLLDEMINLVLTRKQDRSDVGWTYL